MSNEIDPQDVAETFDEDLVGGGGRVLSDEAPIEFPPEHPLGVPFADADVTDESLEDRLEQEEPDILPILSDDEPDEDVDDDDLDDDDEDLDNDDEDLDDEPDDD